MDEWGRKFGTSIIRELEAKRSSFPVFAKKNLKLENTTLYEITRQRQPHIFSCASRTQNL